MKAAAVQITAGPSKEDNTRKIEEWIAKAAEQKATLIVLPEHWNWCGQAPDKKTQAETMTGPSIRRIQELAKKYQCVIVAGSMAEANGDKPPFNTSVVVHADGRLGKPYRKIHLFDAAVGMGHRESAHTTAGSEIVVEPIIPSPLAGEGQGEGVDIGLAICFDLRFPELFQKMASMGANLMALPSNFTAVTGPPHWEILVRARAIENQCFVIAADQTGTPGNGQPSHGHSMIVDPWGDVLAKLGKEEGIIVADLDFGKLKEIRRKMPVTSSLG